MELRESRFESSPGDEPLDGWPEDKTGRLQLPELVGRGRAFRKLVARIHDVATGDEPVLLHGEAGTGKKLVAARIHAASRRRDAPCLRVPANELSSGEAMSLFAGRHDRPGLLESAVGGTVFVDEVTGLDDAAQRLLALLLESRHIRRLGESEPRSIDVRLIASTRRDPGDALARGVLRGDLLERLAGATIRIPPLRERKEDVPPLAHELLRELVRDQAEGACKRRISLLALDALARHDWGGNVRELRDALRTALERAGDSLWIESAHLPDGFDRAVPSVVAVPVGSKLEDVERELIARTLDAFDGNKKEAAEALGISRSALYSKLSRLGR